MAISTEVDDLDRQIVRLEEDLRKRKLKIIQISNDIQKIEEYIKKCFEGKGLCKINLIRIKESYVIDFIEYKEMKKLYEDNHDLLIQHQIVKSNKNREIKEIQEAIPVVESFLKEAKKQRQEWGVIIQFPK